MHYASRHPERLQIAKASQEAQRPPLTSKPSGIALRSAATWRDTEERFAFEELEDEAAMSAEPSGRPSEQQMAVAPVWRSFAGIPDIRAIKRPEPGRNHKLWVSFGQV